VMLHPVDVRADVSEELSASIIRVTRIGKLGTLAVTSNRRTLRRNSHSVRRLLVMDNVPSLPILVTLMNEALSSSETSVLTTSHKTPFFIVTAVKTSNLTTLAVTSNRRRISSERASVASYC
jgi:phosphatidate phosphatase APP1